MRVRGPRVSVVIPAYSRVHFLRECLQSIRSQTMPEFECIVVDDASPEGTAIRREVESLDDLRFDYVRRGENGGPAAARNTGIRLTTAKYFVCVDEDDLLAVHALERLLHRIEASGADAVCPQATMFGGRTGRRQAEKPTLEMILRGMCLLPNGWIMKKDVWESIGGYDEAPELLGRDDWEIWVRFLASQKTVDILDESLYFWRFPDGGPGKPGSLENTVRLQEVKFIKYVLQKHQTLFDCHVDIWRAVLARALSIEAKGHKEACNYWRAARRAIELLFVETRLANLRMAAYLLCVASLGPSITRRLRSIACGRSHS